MQLLKAKDRGELDYLEMKAIFLDRDGVINELIYYSEHGIIDSPFTPEQFRLLPKVAQAITKFHELGFKVIIASNQPGIAKGYLSEETFAEIRNKMEKELAKEGVFLDGEYYCFHHPEAKVERFKVNCKCRKPEPGLLLKAAKDMDINLSQSWMIGDGLTDVRAGKSAGCRTILLGKMKCELCHLMDEQDARPDAIALNLLQAAQKVEEVLSQEKSQVLNQEKSKVLSPKSNIRGRSHLNPGPRTSDIGPRTSDIRPRTLTRAIQRFEDIEAWKEARGLVNLIYNISEKREFAKDFSLKNQIRSASVSIMSNIAEGFDRSSDREFIQFLVIARASASEVKSQLHIALDRGYIDHSDFEAISGQANSVISLINGFIRYLRKPRPRTSDIRPRTSDIGLRTSDIGHRT